MVRNTAGQFNISNLDEFTDLFVARFVTNIKKKKEFDELLALRMEPGDTT